MAYLHGAEVVELEGLKIMRESDTAIIAVVGVAAQGDTDLTLITNLDDAKAKYGDDLEGTTIISALTRIYKNGNIPVLVVNVADATDQLDMINVGVIGFDTNDNSFYTQINNETFKVIRRI